MTSLFKIRYDFIYEDKLEWPSLTVEWIPGHEEY